MIASLAASLAVLQISACTSTPRSASFSGITIIATPKDWTISDQIAVLGRVLYYLATSVAEPDGAPDLWQVDAAGTVRDLGTISIGGECEYAYLADLKGLPSGRLGADATCADADPYKSFYVTIDVAHGRPTASIVSKLESVYQSVVWDDAEMRTGWLVYSESTDCASIARIDNGQPTPFGTYSPQSTFAWPVDYDTLHPDEQDCTARGKAGYLDIDRLKNIVFMAATSAAGKSNPQRRNAPWTVLSMNASRAISTLGTGFVDPSGLATSPVAALVAISATYSGTAGIWVIDTVSGHVQLLQKGTYGPPAFTADGTKIVTWDANRHLVEFSS